MTQELQQEMPWFNRATSVLFTGPAIPFQSWPKQHIQQVADRTKELLDAFIAEGYRNFVTSLEPGYSLFASEVILQKRDELFPYVDVQFIVLIPEYPSDAVRRKFNNAWQRFYDAADQKYILSAPKLDNLGSPVHTRRSLNKMTQIHSGHRNFVLSRVNHVVGVWKNGEEEPALYHRAPGYKLGRTSITVM